MFSPLTPINSSPFSPRINFTRDEKEQYTQLLKNRFKGKKIFIDDNALAGKIQRLRDQLINNVRCNITSDVETAEVFLTTRASYQRAKSNLGASPKPVVKPKARNKRHLKLMTQRANSSASKYLTPAEKFIKSHSNHKDQRIYYEQIQSALDLIWPPPSERPDKYRFSHPKNGAYVFVTDQYGLYKIEPAQIDEMPSIPEDNWFKDMCSLTEHRCSPFNLVSRGKRDRKKKKDRDGKVYCDLCDDYIPVSKKPFEAHEESNRHQNKVKITDWSELDETFRKANSRWEEELKKTQEIVDIHQKRGEEYTLVEPYLDVDDMDGFIEMLTSGQNAGETSKLPEPPKKKRKMVEKMLDPETEKRAVQVRSSQSRRSGREKTIAKLKNFPKREREPPQTLILANDHPMPDQLLTQESMPPLHNSSSP